MKILIIGGATTRTMRAHWAAHELGLDYESQLIGSRTGETQTKEFLALNPKAKIPVLSHDGLVLTESAAIIYYLDQVAGSFNTAAGSLPSAAGALPTAAGALPTAAGAPLIPTEPQTLARYQEWQSYILMELDAQTLYIMRKHGDLAHIYGEAPVAMETARTGFNFQVKAAASALESTPFLLGDSFSGVDILLTTVLDWAVAYDFTLADSLLSYLERIQTRGAYISARAHNFSKPAPS